MILPPVPDIAVVEGDEILMGAITSIRRLRYRVKYNKDKTPYEPFKDVKSLRKKKDMLLWLQQKGLTHEIEEYATYGTFQQAKYQLDKKVRALYREMPYVKICQFFVGPLDGSNFRYKRAKTQPYKGSRPEKPEVLLELREYLINVYGAQVAWGHESDDSLGMNEGIKVHCDKDIYMIPGWHFDTITRKLEYVDYLGSLWLKEKIDKNERKTRELKGRGIAFFYAQLLTGDRTDTIPNLAKGYGSVKAYELLKNCKCEDEYIMAVVWEYQQVMGDSWRERLLEQADLVFICRKEGEYGSDYLGEKLNAMV